MPVSGVAGRGVVRSAGDSVRESVRSSVRSACRRAVVAVTAIAAALTATAPVVHAQGFVNELTLSSGALVVPEPTIANFSSWPPSASGPVSDSVPLTWQVTTPRQSNWWRYVVVSVRCEAVAGGKPCDDVEWRDPSGTWRALSPGGAVLDARWVLPGITFDDYGSAIWLRWRLAWDDPAPATHVATVGLTVEVYRL
jgi:hypothetical protein